MRQGADPASLVGGGGVVSSDCRAGLTNLNAPIESPVFARTAFVSSEAGAGSGADESVELAALEAQAGTSASPCSSVDDAKVHPCSPMKRCRTITKHHVDLG